MGPLVGCVYWDPGSRGIRVIGGWAIEHSIGAQAYPSLHWQDASGQIIHISEFG
jgi:hypothetical protein